jgi:hypothetical protein
MGLIGDITGGSSASCTPLPTDAYTAADVVNGWTLNHLMIVVAGALFGFTALICLGLGTMHLSHYSKPQEQRQYVDDDNKSYF